MSVVELTAANAYEYLRGRGIEAGRITELGGGVSNTVLLIEGEGRRMVLKQSLGRLRVQQEWLSERGRIFRESGALKGLAEDFAPGSLPEVVFEDRENFAFAMTAAPVDAVSWKSLLLEGAAEDDTAHQVGALLAAMIRASLHSQRWAEEFGDQTVFDQLRLDAYYRTTARRHPDIAACIDRLISDSAQRRVSLVHGDWSPKNFLVSGGKVMAIDFEVIHFGDPAFDTAFLLNHLLLKSYFRPQWAGRYGRVARCFWETLFDGLPRECAPIQAWTWQHLGCLLLARIDGKSPAEYIRDPDMKEEIRQRARQMIVNRPRSIEEAFPDAE